MTANSKTENPEHCPQVTLAPDYLLDELSPPAKSEFEAHIANCPACGKAVESFRLIIHGMKRIPDETCGHDLSDRVLASLPADAWKPKTAAWWHSSRFPAMARIAAVLLAAVLIGILATLPSLQNSGKSSAEVKIAASPATPLDKARQWLQKAQAADGGWTSGDAADHSIGVSSLALLAFMEKNPDVFHGPYAATVRKGIDNLAARQDEQGLIGPRVSTATYNQGLATLVLLNASALESNAVWKTAADKAVKLICLSQSASGGWGYLTADQGQANTSASIWPIQALIRANELKFPGLRPNIERGLAWLGSTINQDGFMGYTQTGDSQAAQDDTMTAAGVVCFLKDRKGVQDPAMRAMLPALRGMVAGLDSKLNFYRLFFVSEAMRLADDQQFAEAQNAVEMRLASLQSNNGNYAGCWNASDQWSGVAGPVYSTAMATLALSAN